MIQRIQTLWLFFASVLCFITLKLSFYSGTYLTDNQYHPLNGTSNVLVMIATIVIGVLTFVTIFLYKKRILQLRLTILAIVLELLLIFLYYRETAKFTRGEYSISAALHIVIIIALVFAARGINKDEKLIKDSNRLR